MPLFLYLFYFISLSSVRLSYHHYDINSRCMRIRVIRPAEQVTEISITNNVRFHPDRNLIIMQTIKAKLVSSLFGQIHLICHIEFKINLVTDFHNVPDRTN